jgi:hypothetical protein
LHGTCFAAGALVGLGAPLAAAAPPEPFTIAETIDFNTEEAPTFEATGALCPSGTFEDQVETLADIPKPPGSSIY